jgi:hypothetical protein
MLGNIGETYTHGMKHGPIPSMSLRPNPLCGSEYSFTFTWFQDEAKTVEKVRNSRALDEHASEAEVLDRACDEANFSYEGHRPVNFNPWITAVVDSHNGAPVLPVY